MSAVDIASLVASLPQFSILAALLSAAELVPVLSGGSLTLLAPTNYAFRKLPWPLVEFLIRPENKLTLVPWLPNAIGGFEDY